MLRQFADGHAVTHRSLPIADERLASRIGDGPLHVDSTDGIGPIEHEDRLLCLRGCFKKIPERTLVGVEAHANVLNVVDNRIQIGKFFGSGPPFRVRVAVDAIDGNAGRGIVRVANGGGVECAGNAVLGAEDRLELNAGRMCENIRSALAVRIEPRSDWLPARCVPDVRCRDAIRETHAPRVRRFRL